MDSIQSETQNRLCTIASSHITIPFRLCTKIYLQDLMTFITSLLFRQQSFGVNCNVPACNYNPLQQINAILQVGACQVYAFHLLTFFSLCQEKLAEQAWIILVIVATMYAPTIKMQMKRFSYCLIFQLIGVNECHCIELYLHFIHIGLVCMSNVLYGLIKPLISIWWL